MELKVTKNGIEGGLIGAVFLGFLVLKVFVLGSIEESSRFMKLFLEQSSYSPVIESGVVVDSYSTIFAYIANIFNPSIEVGGMLVYLGLIMQICSIMLLTISARMLVGDIGGTASILGFCAIFLQTDPLVSFITLIAAIHISLFARFQTYYFNKETTLVKTIIFGVLFGLISSVHASLSTYGLYLSFVLILVGGILVSKYQLIQVVSALIPFLLVNYIWRGYSLFTYGYYIGGAFQDLATSIQGEHFGIIMGNLLFVSVVAVVCFGIGSQKLVFTIFLMSISQLLYAIVHDFHAQGKLAMYLFVVLTGANAIELFYQAMFPEEVEIEIKKVDAHTILKDMEYVEPKDEKLKEPSKLSTSNMAMLESSIDRFGSAGVFDESSKVNVVDTSLNQSDIMSRHLMKESVEREVEEDPYPYGNVPSVHDILGDLSPSEDPSLSQEVAPLEQIQPVQEEVKMIENPLPVPKKHVPSEMDFAIDLTEWNNDFDLVNYDNQIEFDIT